MQTVTFNVPNWFDPFGSSSQTWLLVISVLATALLASIVVEVYKRHYTAKQQEALAKHYIALLLTFLTALFTAASYFITFAQTNAGIVNVIPFLGRHVPQAVGAAYIIYNLRLNKTYQTVASKLNSWSKEEKTPTTTVTTPSGTTEAMTPATTEQDLFQ